MAQYRKAPAIQVDPPSASEMPRSLQGHMQALEDRIMTAVRSRTSHARIAVEARVPSIGEEWVALRSFTYCGSLQDRGSILKVVGTQNDEKLGRLGYMRPYDQRQHGRFPCRYCEQVFIALDVLNGHGARRHEPRELAIPSAPQRDSRESEDAYQNRLDTWSEQAGRLADARDEEWLSREQQIAPLRLDQTTASRS